MSDEMDFEGAHNRLTNSMRRVKKGGRVFKGHIFSKDLKAIQKALRIAQRVKMGIVSKALTEPEKPCAVDVEGLKIALWKALCSCEGEAGRCLVQERVNKIVDSVLASQNLIRKPIDWEGK